MRLPNATPRTLIPYDLQEGRVQDALYDARTAIGSFNWMLSFMLRGGDGLCEEDAHGIHTLLETQVMILTGIEDSLSETLGERDELRQSLERQTAAVAEDARLAEANADKIHGLRRQMIAGAIGKGAEPGEIAAAFNMKRATVERVIRQLQGADATPETPQGQAVTG